MKFRVTQYIKDYVKVGEEYRHVEVENDYESDRHDDALDEVRCRSSKEAA